MHRRKFIAAVGGLLAMAAIPWKWAQARFRAVQKSASPHFTLLHVGYDPQFVQNALRHQTEHPDVAVIFFDTLREAVSKVESFNIIYVSVLHTEDISGENPINLAVDHVNILGDRTDGTPWPYPYSLTARQPVITCVGPGPGVTVSARNSQVSGLAFNTCGTPQEPQDPCIEFSNLAAAETGWVSDCRFSPADPGKAVSWGGLHVPPTSRKFGDFDDSPLVPRFENNSFGRVVTQDKP